MKIAPTRGFGFLEGFLAKKRAEMAEKLIPDASRDGCILDIGCGYWPFFLIRTEFNKKIGLDRFVCENLPFNIGNLSIIKTDFLSDGFIPIPDSSCDIVTMLAVFEHLEPERLNKTLSEIHRTLRPKGRLIMTTPTPWTDQLLRAMAGIHLVSRVEIAEHKGAYSHIQLLKLVGGVFSRDKIRTGYFEMFMNSWLTADK